MPGATRERFAHAHVTATGVPRQRLATFRDEFRIAIAGSATAGANGSFAGVRREINWNGASTARRSEPAPRRLLQRVLAARCRLRNTGAPASWLAPMRANLRQSNSGWEISSKRSALNDCSQRSTARFPTLTSSSPGRIRRQRRTPSAWCSPTSTSLASARTRLCAACKGRRGKRLLQR